MVDYLKPRNDIQGDRKHLQKLEAGKKVTPTQILLQCKMKSEKEGEMGVGGESHIDLKFCFIQRAAAPGMGNICYPQQSSHSSLFLATRVLEAMYKCYTFLFLFFL